MSRFWSPFVQSLVPYVPGEQPRIQNLTKLNTNENPYGPSPTVLAAIKDAADDSLRLYPDPDARELKQVIAEYHNQPVDNIFIGNGSDEVLAHLFNGFFRHDNPICFPEISYSFYKVYCGLYQIDYHTLPLTDDFKIDVDAFPSDAPGIIFPNPNAPTGCALPLSDIERLLQRCPDTLVVVDEAYVDFGAKSAITLVSKYENLLVSQTLSKSRSLAGMRLGFAVGQPALIDGLERIKNSFNSYPIDKLAIAAGVASFADEDWFQRCREKVMSERARVSGELVKRGFQVLPSEANFVFAKHESQLGADLAAALRGHGVIVRHFNSPERISNYLRITIGTAEQNTLLLTALDQEL